jgi:hypothetical protein
MELFYSYQFNHYYPEEDPYTVTSAILNKYVPTYVVSNIRRFSKHPDLFYYTKPLFNSSELRTRSNTIKNIISLFSGMESNPRTIKIGSQTYFIMFNAIFTDKGEPLAIITLRQKDFLDQDLIRELRSLHTIDYSKLVLLYASELLTEKKHSPLSRKLQPELLVNTCFIKGIEVKLMPSAQIEKNTFARVFEIKKTTTLTGLHDYLNTVLPNIFCSEEEDTFEEKLNVRKIVTEIPYPIAPPVPSFVPPTEELSIEEEALFYSDEEEESTHIDYDYDIWDEEEETLEIDLDHILAADAHEVNSPVVIWRSSRRIRGVVIELLDE